MKMPGPPKEVLARTKAYMRAQGLFHEPGMPEPEYTDMLELDLESVVPSLAGPKRPQDRVPMSELKETFSKALTAPVRERGFELKPEALNAEATFGANGGSLKMKHG